MGRLGKEAVRRCTKCECWFPETLEYFTKHSTRKDGTIRLRAICKECEQEYKREYYKENRERENKRSSEWQKRNPEKTRAKQRRFYARNKSRLNAKRVEWSRRNKDKQSAIMRSYYRKKKERMKNET